MNKQTDLVGRNRAFPDDPSVVPADVPNRLATMPATPKTRFDLAEMEASWDPDLNAVWSFMTPASHPRFSQSMLRDLQAWQTEIQRLTVSEGAPVSYVVLGSRYPGTFNMGGDLDFVAEAIERRDESALEAYGNQCVDILFRNYQTLGLPLVTIALIQGDAVGGGFESALSFNVLVAERHATFSFPENLFGMFPGVGAHALLTRKLGAAATERLMLSGKTYTAEEMHALGLIHVLAEPGEGEEATRAYIRQNAKKLNSHLSIYRAAREVNPLELAELRRIVRIWAETGMKLSAQQIKTMRRLAGRQARS
jgi:DSF synthase